MKGTIFLIIIAIILAGCGEGSSEGVLETKKTETTKPTEPEETTDPVKSTETVEGPILFTEYVSEIYSYTVDIPDNWDVFRNMTTSADGGHVDWSIPAVINDLDGREIRNTIGISSIKGDGSAEELMDWNIGEMEGTVDEIIENRKELSVTIKFKQNGLTYAGKSYFMANNGMGYMITFVSTPGTFMKNLKVFESFKSRVKFD